MHIKLKCLLTLTLLKIAHGSLGDRSKSFQLCRTKCVQDLDCPSKVDSFWWITQKCFWCRYDCMWQTVESFERNYGIVPQFHGKWPFAALPIPVFGLIIQEPASTIFSLLNLLTFFIMIREIRKIDGIQHRKMWTIYGHAGLVVWIFSTIFHIFDCDVTEKMDYFSAFGFILCALFVSIHFTNPQLLTSSNGKIMSQFMALSFTGYYVYHVLSMINHFDYGWNMSICIFSSLFASLMYIIYLVKRKREFGELHQSDILLIRLLIWTNLSTALELIDFVPVFWIFDSHSLFHLATVPIPLWWVQFLRETHCDILTKQNIDKIA